MAAQISSILDAHLKKAPAQKKNVEAMNKFITGDKNLPNSKTPVLYAIDGKVGLANITDYAKILRDARAKNSKAVVHCYVGDWFFKSSDLLLKNREPLLTFPQIQFWIAQLMAGPAKPTSTTTPNPQTQLAQYAYFDRSQNLSYAHEIRSSDT